MEKFLKKVKARCEIAEYVDYYDEQIKDLILAAIADMKQSGIPDAVIFTDNKYLGALVLNALAAYVKTYLGNDRSDVNRYLKAYESIRHRLTYEIEEDWQCLM